LARRAVAGVEAQVIAPGSGPLADALDRLSIPRISWPPGYRFAVDRVAQLLAQARIEIVHANSLMTADAALAVSEFTGMPAIAHVRDIMRLSAARRRRLSRLARIIAVSDAVADWLRRHDLGGNQIVRIYNAVDSTELRNAVQPGLLRAELGIESQPLVGCVGQITIRKGQDVFLEAAGKLLERVPDAHFVIVGARFSRKAESRQYEDRLHRLADLPPLAGRVRFLGYCSDVGAVLSDLDLFVVPSRQEPLSRALLEAMAVGVATIATDVGGNAEILDGGRCGCLIPPGDPIAMAECMAAVLCNHRRRRELVERARERVDTRFSPVSHAREIRHCYVGVLGKAPSSTTTAFNAPPISAP
jgi:glycosyltransferase involved in cell wall biosynthesis